MNSCSVCLIGHDPETHAATQRVRKFLRDQVEKWTSPFSLETRAPEFDQVAERIAVEHRYSRTKRGKKKV